MNLKRAWCNIVGHKYGDELWSICGTMKTETCKRCGDVLVSTKNISDMIRSVFAMDPRSLRHESIDYDGKVKRNNISI